MGLLLAEQMVAPVLFTGLCRSGRPQREFDSFGSVFPLPFHMAVRKLGRHLMKQLACKGFSVGRIPAARRWLVPQRAGRRREFQGLRFRTRPAGRPSWRNGAFGHTWQRARSLQRLSVGRA